MTKSGSERKKKCKKSETENSDLSESYRLGSESSERVYTFGPRRSLADVKQELSTMLDKMGPETPQFQTTSSEADNDTSIITSSSIMEHRIKNDSDQASLSQASSESQGTTTCSDTKNSSVLVEFPSSLDGRAEEVQDLYDNTLCNIHGFYNTAPIQHSYMMNQYASGDHRVMGDNSCSNNMQPYYNNGNGFVKKRKGILEWFGFKPALNPESDLYKVKIKQEFPNALPKQLTFERADGAPRSISPFGVGQTAIGMQRPRPLGPAHSAPLHNTEDPAFSPLAHYSSPLSHSRLCNRYEETCTMCETYGPESHAVRSLNYCRSCLVPACSDYSCPYLEGNGESHMPYHQMYNPGQTSILHDDNEDMYITPEVSRSAPAINQPHSCGGCPVNNRSKSYSERLHTSKHIGKNYSTGSSPRKDDTPTKDSGSYIKADVEKNDSKQDFMDLHHKGTTKASCHTSKCDKVKCVCRSVKSVREFGKESTYFGNSASDVEHRANDMVHLGLSDMDQHNVTYHDTSGATRVDVYYFDHGNSGYYRTTDWAPHLSSEVIAQKTEAYTSRFWAEVFGTIHIGFSFCTSFVLQFIRFILYSLMRPLVIGVLQLGSDYFFKPSLSTCFNSIIQPLLIFLYNIASSIRDLCDPIASGIGYYIREVAIFVRSLRIIEINQVRQTMPESCAVCSKKISKESTQEEIST